MFSCITEHSASYKTTFHVGLRALSDEAAPLPPKAEHSYRQKATQHFENIREIETQKLCLFHTHFLFGIPMCLFGSSQSEWHIENARIKQCLPV